MNTGLKELKARCQCAFWRLQMTHSLAFSSFLGSWPLPPSLKPAAQHLPIFLSDLCFFDLISFFSAGGGGRTVIWYTTKHNCTML